jgi:hypothetical protein
MPEAQIEARRLHLVRVIGRAAAIPPEAISARIA